MMNNQDVFAQNISIDFVQEGMKLGSKAGFRLSVLYAIAGIFIVEVLSTVWFLDWGEIGSFDPYQFFRAVPLFLLIALFILLVAIGPATILGILTGMVLGKFVELTIRRVSKYFLIISCALLCLIIAVLIHRFFDIHVVFSFQLPTTQHYSMGIYETYPFYMGIPTIVYVLAGGWTGWQLYSKSLIQIGERN